MTNINPRFDRIKIKQTAANGYCELNPKFGNNRIIN